MVFWFGVTKSDSAVPLQGKGPIESMEQKEPGSDWLRGQLFHLTQKQECTLHEFKHLCKLKGLCVPDDGTDQDEEEFDNAMLLRFLRANKFQLHDAVDQFQAVSRARAEHEIEAVYRRMDVDCYEESRKMFAQWTGRRDHRGLPVYVFPLQYLTKEKMDAYISKMSSSSSASGQIPGPLVAFHALYENLLHFVLPLCSRLPRPHPEVPITASTHIIDMTGLTLKQFLDIKRYLQAASELATAHYPETLGRVFIIGAPPALRVAWRFVKQWLDPETLSKICIFSPAEMQQRCLFKYMPETSIPVEYGGTLDWKWGDMPVLDEPGRALAGGLYSFQKVGGSQTEVFVEGPVVWSRGGGMEVVGTVEGRRRERVIPLGDKGHLSND
ncbi:SEC14 family lipid-binding protein [Aspergillus affinis]|uniref:SEC14 family lipid-binding protein n=1 Tax=Aspergillus affinis TaxID=1070780 RepID=UPI0022FEF16B|nr:uncharacterized protein KD926_000222 [Aspergillus affinis]KAI9037574.1 hypothetical protein KD926_000222 [Aspergillus affinis]